MSSLQQPCGVISTAFCAPHPLQLSLKKKAHLFSLEYEVKDGSNDRFIFKAKCTGSYYNCSKVVIYDTAGNPLVTLRPKGNSSHMRWQVFRGESKEKTDIIFSAKLSSFFQLFHKNLDVFLHNNRAENVCDFKVKTSFTTRTCDIYGPSSSLIAQMKREGLFFGRFNFMVSVNPNVDHAFIVALIIILDQILLARLKEVFAMVVERRGSYLGKFVHGYDGSRVTDVYIEYCCCK